MSMKRIVAVFLAAVMALGLLAGCGASDTSDEKTTTGTTAAGETTAPAKTYKITMLGLRTTPNPDSEVMKKFNENLGGNTLEVTGVQDADYLAKVQLLMAAQDLPDIFANWNNLTVLEKATAKYTADEFKTYMPNIYAIGEKQFGRIGMTMDTVLGRGSIDGKVAGFVIAQTLNMVPYGILVRQDLLDEYGLPMPKTFSDWEALFKAYKQKNPDKYPITARGKDWIIGAFRWVTSAYGITYSTNQDGWQIRDGKLSYDAFSPEMREVLGTLQNWYKAGYINPEWVTTNNQQYIDLFSKGDLVQYQILNPTTPVTAPYQAGSMMDNLTKNVPAAKVSWAPYPAAKEGNKPYYPLYDPVGNNFICFGSHLQNDPDKLHAAMTVLDKGTTREMYMLRTYGIEGVTYDMVNGAPQWKPELNNSNEAQANAGVNWMGLYMSAGIDFDIQKSFSPKDVQEQLDKLFLADDGLYGKNNIRIAIGSPSGGITSQSGEDLIVKGKAKSDQWNTLFSEIVTGKKTLDNYDKFVVEWKKEVLDEMTDAVNRLYLDGWAK